MWNFITVTVKEDGLVELFVKVFKTHERAKSRKKCGVTATTIFNIFDVVISLKKEHLI